MKSISDVNKRREDLKTLAISSVWDELKYLARKEESSASSYIRRLIKKLYEKEILKERRKDLTLLDA